MKLVSVLRFWLPQCITQRLTRVVFYSTTQAEDHATDVFIKLNTPVLYFLHDGPKHSFVREQLLVLPILNYLRLLHLPVNYVGTPHRLCVDTIFQNPTLVVVCTQLLLLVSFYRAFMHSEPRFVAMSFSSSRVCCNAPT